MLAALALVASMVVPPMTEAELRAKADVVVDGTVVRQEVHRLAGRLFTFSTLLAGEGVTAKSYLVALPGGALDGIAQRVPGSPQLQLGQRYRLYLGKADGPTVPGGRVAARGVVGFYRGVFFVDGARNDALVPFSEDGLPALEPR